ncbi:pirin family protein [Mesorhizobium sp. BHbdii]
MSIRQTGVTDIVLPVSSEPVSGFKVRRVLPSRYGRMVGPFVLFDQMGPAVFNTGQGLDVGPHPHIGLAAMTCLVDGEIVHRDSLGTVQALRPGEVSWMTAGSGIVHSERTPPEARASGSNFFGIQAWVALPCRDEEAAADFAHYSEPEIPRTCARSVEFTLIAGASDGLVSPVRTFSDMVFTEIVLTSGARYQVKPEHHGGLCRRRRGRDGRPAGLVP